MARKPGKNVQSIDYIYPPTDHSDILRPIIISCDGMNFRKLNGGRPTSFSRRHEEPLFPEVDDEETCVDEFEDLEDVRELENGSYELKLLIPNIFFKYVIGRQGKTKETIEKDTHCRLQLPRRGEDGPIVLHAKSKRSLSSAKQRIEVIMWSNRQKEDITHFICIPLGDKKIQDKVAEFKNDVLRTCGKCEGVDEQLFQSPIKMHITLAVFKLFTEKEQFEASLAIQKAVEVAKAALGSPAKHHQINLKGIACFTDDYSAVNVLYAEVHLEDGSNKLQIFADTLVKELKKTIPELVSCDRDRNHVKLHATLMNTAFKKKEEYDWRISRQVKQNNCFDTRKIFNEYDDYDFCSQPLNEVVLVKRGEKESNGFYKIVSTYNI